MWWKKSSCLSSSLWSIQSSKFQASNISCNILIQIEWCYCNFTLFSWFGNSFETQDIFSFSVCNGNEWKMCIAFLVFKLENLRIKQDQVVFKNKIWEKSFNFLWQMEKNKTRKKIKKFILWTQNHHLNQFKLVCILTSLLEKSTGLMQRQTSSPFHSYITTAIKTWIDIDIRYTDMDKVQFNENKTCLEM